LPDRRDHFSEFRQDDLLEGKTGDLSSIFSKKIDIFKILSID
jgi:hypothetical protein